MNLAEARYIDELGGWHYNVEAKNLWRYKARSNKRYVEILLSNEMVTLIDAEMHLHIAGICQWTANSNNKKFAYASGRINVDGVQKTVLLHRFIYEKVHGHLPHEIDHYNRKKMDNTIENLRDGTYINPRNVDLVSEGVHTDNTRECYIAAYTGADGSGHKDTFYWHDFPSRQEAWNEAVAHRRRENDNAERAIIAARDNGTIEELRANAPTKTRRMTNTGVRHLYLISGTDKKPLRIAGLVIIQGVHYTSSFPLRLHGTQEAAIEAGKLWIRQTKSKHLKPKKLDGAKPGDLWIADDDAKNAYRHNIDGSTTMLLQDGYTTIIDTSEHQRARSVRWFRDKISGYAKGTVKIAGKSSSVRLHRFLHSDKIYGIINHRNGDQLDNRLASLGSGERSVNSLNKKNARNVYKQGRTYVAHWKDKTGRRSSKSFHPRNYDDDDNAAEEAASTHAKKMRQATIAELEALNLLPPDEVEPIIRYVPKKRVSNVGIKNLCWAGGQSGTNQKHILANIRISGTLYSTRFYLHHYPSEQAAIEAGQAWLAEIKAAHPRLPRLKKRRIDAADNGE